MNNIIQFPKSLPPDSDTRLDELIKQLIKEYGTEAVTKSFCRVFNSLAQVEIDKSTE
jgi:hypothetical protein